MEILGTFYIYRLQAQPVEIANVDHANTHGHPSLAHGHAHGHAHDHAHLKGETAEPHEQHHLYKRSLEHLLNKLDFKVKKLELKRQKWIKHYALKGKAHGMKD
jgi:hypothetical protein